MKIIDAHFHYSNLECFILAAKDNGVDYSKTGFEKEYKDNCIVSGVCMGLEELSPGSFPDNHAKTPMTYNLDILPKDFYYCAGVNPHHLNDEDMISLEKELLKPQCVGIKLYAGYYHYFLTDKVYQSIYTLALKHKLPVVVHMGDTYSQKGLLKYSHPLIIDEIAVQYPELKLMIAHLGNPWLMETAEILYKNKNVFSDLSGLQVGNKAVFDRFSAQELYLNMFRTALILADSYDKLIFGTDWPLAPLSVYIDFVKKIIPQEHYEAVFYENALRFFTKIKEKR